MGEIELDAPTRSPFVLRATLPVPPRLFPRPDGLIPLAIRGPDGLVVPTQVEVVSRYAADGDGADVVELLGRVELPPGSAPGERVRYAVVEHLHPGGPLPVGPDILKLLLTRGQALLVAEDVFGNRYQADLFRNLRAFTHHPRSKLLRKGQASVQVRTYSVMEPTGTKLGAPDGALPHLLGVHAYTTVWAETDALTVDLRLHNGFDGHDQADPLDDPLGKVYFRWVELWLPRSWVALQDVDDVATGKAYADGDVMRFPLIAPLADGRMHVMPHQGQTHRRLGISRASDPGLALHLAYDAGLGFCRPGLAPDGADLWSWWNPQTARYFPQRHVLPDLDFIGQQALAGTLSGMYWMARTALETGNPGNYAVPSGALGWAHPWGVAYGGMTGGVEINLYDGVQLATVGSNNGWKSVQMAHRMNADRQPFVLFDRHGEPSAIEDWVQESPFPHVNMNFWGTLLAGPDPFGFWSAPTYQVQHVEASGLKPAYEDLLVGHMPHDFQHFVRYTRSPKVLAWLGHDALAEDDLRQAAEIARMSMHAYPDGAGKHHAGSSLFVMQQIVAGNPGQGLPWGRGEAWSLDAAVAAYAVGDPDYRARVRPWLRHCADLVAQGQASCSGFIQASQVNHWLTGEYLYRSQPEHTISEHALWGLVESVFRGSDPARTEQTRAVLAQATGTVIGPIAWSDSLQAPWFIAATAPKDPAQPAFCAAPPPNGVGYGPDGYFSWASFGYGYEATGEAEFLDKAAAMSGGGNLYQNLLYLVHKGTTSVESAAALLALLQG